MRLRLHFPAQAALVVAAMATPAHAQLDINLGGIGISVGGSSGGVNVGVDGPGGLDVQVGLGGSGGGSDGDLPGTPASAEYPPVEYPPGQGGASSSGPVHIVPLGQDELLMAVKAKRAVPLAPIVAQLQAADLKVVDAQLVTVRGILLYELRVIGQRGDVSELYFYARSGRQVVAD